MSTNIMALYNDSDSDSDNEFFTNKSSARLTRNTSTIYRPGVYEDEENFPEFEVTKNLSKFNRDNITLDDTESIGSDFECRRMKGLPFLVATDMDSVDSDNDFEPYMRGRKLVIATNDPIDNFLGDDREEEEELLNTGVESFADTKEELSRVGETVHAEETAPARNPSLKLLKGKLASKRAIEEARAAARDAKAGKSAKGVLALQKARAGKKRYEAADELAAETQNFAASEAADDFERGLPRIPSSVAQPREVSTAADRSTADYNAVLTGVQALLAGATVRAQDIAKAKETLKTLVEKFKGKRILKEAREAKAKLSKVVTTLQRRFKGKGLLADQKALRAEETKYDAPRVNAETEVEGAEETEAEGGAQAASPANTKTTSWTHQDVTVKTTVSTRKGGAGKPRNVVFYKGARITAGKTPLSVINDALAEASDGTTSPEKAAAVAFIKKIAANRRLSYPAERAAEAAEKAARAEALAAAPAAGGGGGGSASAAARAQSVSKAESAAGGRKVKVKVSGSAGGGGGGKK